MLRSLSKVFSIIKKDHTLRPSSPQRRLQSQLNLEQLDSRDLPSTHVFASDFAGMAMSRHALHAAHARVSQITSSSSQTTTGSSSSSSENEANEQNEGCHHGSDSTTFAATLANSTGATGTASYSANNNSLRIQVTGAAANASLDVQLDGTSIGTLTTDASGNGSLKLKNLTNPVTATSTLTVGDLTGTFTQESFSASLTGTGSMKGNATYKASRHDLDIRIKGATANTTYNVLLDGNSVGTFTTKSSGNGRFDLDLSTLNIQAGTILTITDSVNTTILTGTFA